MNWPAQKLKKFFTLACAEKEATISSPVLSIIIPVYNGEKCIKGCLDSIIQAPIPVEYEILVVSDGSTAGPN